MLSLSAKTAKEGSFRIKLFTLIPTFIGGASMYAQMIDFADKMLLTEIAASADASVYFPRFNKDDWNRDILSEHEYNGLAYKHVKYVRKK